jgi:hypothetical protein
VGLGIQCSFLFLIKTETRVRKALVASLTRADRATIIVISATLPSCHDVVPLRSVNTGRKQQVRCECARSEPPMLSIRAK